MNNDILFRNHRTFRFNETNIHLAQVIGGYLLNVNTHFSAALTQPFIQDGIESYGITRIEVNVKYVGFDKRQPKYISSCQKLVDLSCPSDDCQFSMQFPVSHLSLEEIENVRQDSPKFQIEITLEMLTDKRYLLKGTIDFEVPVDKWLNELDRIGFKHCKLFEIPSIEINGDPLTELNHAYKFYMQGHYDDAVAHCRTAVDSIANYPSLRKSLKRNLESNSIAKEYVQLIEAERKMLGAIIEATMKITSRTHHGLTIGHFEKHTAQEILTMTTVFVSRLSRAASSMSINDDS